MKKNKNPSNLILKSFIILAVLMILLNVIHSEGEKYITKITERLIFCYNCYSV